MMRRHGVRAKGQRAAFRSPAASGPGVWIALMLIRQWTDCVLGSLAKLSSYGRGSVQERCAH